MTLSNVHVLVVDDDPRALDDIGRALRSEGVNVTVARTGAAAVAALERTHFDAVILDLDRPMLDGAGFYRTLRALPRDVPVLVLSSDDGEAAPARLRGLEERTRRFNMARLIDDVQQVGQLSDR
jgi:two-component system response regulator PrrA